MLTIGFLKNAAVKRMAVISTQKLVLMRAMTISKNENNLENRTPEEVYMIDI
jgi:hypothetical protein